MKLNRPLYFVIHLDRLATDVGRVSHLIETTYKADLVLENKIISNHSLEREAQLLRQFPLTFRGLIETITSLNKKDFFENTFLGYDKYEYVEIIVSYDYKTLSSIRFLGTKKKKPIRFALYGIPNVLFDPTTLNIISNIRTISNTVSDFFGKITDLFCTPGAPPGIDMENINSTMNMMPVLNSIDVISTIGWYDFVNTYFLPSPIIMSKTSLTKEGLEAIEKKFDVNLYKTFEELQKETEEMFGLRGEISKLTKKGFEINNSGKAAFFTDIDKQIETLGALYSNIFDKFTLGCLISEALDCIKPPLNCPDLLRELPIEKIRDRISLAFPSNLDIVEKLGKVIDSVVEQNTANKVVGLEANDRILAEIANVIDIDAICDLKIPFAIPRIELPTFPTIDLMYDINVQLDTSILKALIDAFMALIRGMLKDLLDCNKLDNFVAGVLNGKIADDTGAYGDLAKVFTSPQTFGTNSNTARSFGNRWNNFVNQASPLMDKIIDLDAVNTVQIDKVSFNQITTGEAGLTGLQDVLKGENFENIGASVEITKQEKNVFIDVSDPNKSTNPTQVKKFVREVSNWDISNDKNSFTLNNLTQDKIAIVAKFSTQDTSTLDFKTPSKRSSIIIDGIKENEGKRNPKDEDTHTAVIVEKRITGEELYNEIGKLFDTVISILSPTETINLLAGKATTETLNTILEIIKIRHKKLFVFVYTVQNISMLFEIFGRSVGLDELREKLLLLTASPGANRKNVPDNFCPPFETVDDFRKELLKKTLPPDQVEKIVQDLIDAGKQRFNDIQDGLVQIKKGIPFEALKPLLCGTGRGPNKQRSPIVEDTLDSTINLMFEPAKMMFDREMLKYPEAISIVKEKSEQIKRKINTSSGLPVFNPLSKDGNIFSTVQSLLGIGDDADIPGLTKEKINPEFKALVDGGYVPTKKNGDPDGDPGDNYIKGTEVEVWSKNTERQVAAAFKEGIKFTDEDIMLDLNKKFKITLRGSLDSQSPVSSMTPFKVSTPEWIVEYIEKNRTVMNIRTGGQIHSSVYGLIPFSQNYKIEKDDIALEDKLKEEVLQVSDGLKIPSRQNVFGKIFGDKVIPSLLDDTKDTRESFYDMLENRYESFVKATIKEVSKGFARNRLLKKVPNNSLSNLAPEGTTLGNSKAEDLIVLNLINLSPAPTEQQRACGTDPHLLDFEEIKKMVKDRFDKECEEKTDEDRIDGLSPRRGPINSSGLVGVVLSIIKLYSIEYILRTLFVLDEFKYSKDFLNDDLLIDYITFRTQEDIKRLDFYEVFEKEMKITYQKLLEDGVIEPYPMETTSCSSSDSETEKTSTEESSINLEMKSLVKYQMTSAMKRISEIIGIDKTNPTNLKSVFFEGIETFDTFSDFGEPTKELKYTSNNSRLLELSIPKSGKFIFERYIRVGSENKIFQSNAQTGVNRLALNNEQNKSNFLNDVVNFKNWEEFVNNIIANNPALKLENKKIYDNKNQDLGLFEQPWKMGLRLVYVPPEFGSKVERRQLQNTKNKFRIVDEDEKISYSKIDPNKVDKEKTLYVIDKQRRELNESHDDEYFKQYNPIPILEKEVEITDFITLGEASKSGIFERMFDKKYLKILKKQMIEDIQTDVLIDYCLFSKKMLGLFMIHSTMVLNGEQMKFLFEGTKNELKKLLESLTTLGDYVNKTPFKLKGGNAGEFQRKFNSIGSPAGPGGADAFYYWTTAPIHILKGLAVLTDPNLFWADKIVAAAASGFLAPKFVRVKRQVRIDNTNRFANPAPAIDSIPLDNEFRVTETGELVQLQTKKEGVGKPIIEYTVVADYYLDDKGKVVIKMEELPESKFQDTTGVTQKIMGPVLRSGPTYSGIPWDNTKEPSSPAAGIDLNNFNQLFDHKPSVPVYPGEKINIPYGVASLALTPMQIFATILGPLCATQYNSTLPLGTNFLALEPLIYQLPHFQIAAAGTSVAEDLKEQGIDLKGAAKIKCEDK